MSGKKRKEARESQPALIPFYEIIRNPYHLRHVHKASYKITWWFLEVFQPWRSVIAELWRRHNLQHSSRGDGSSDRQGTSLQGWHYGWLAAGEPILDSHSWAQRRPLFLIFQVPCWSSKRQSYTQKWGYRKTQAKLYPVCLQASGI